MYTAISKSDMPKMSYPSGVSAANPASAAAGEPSLNAVLDRPEHPPSEKPVNAVLAAVESAKGDAGTRRQSVNAPTERSSWQQPLREFPARGLPVRDSTSTAQKKSGGNQCVIS